jgi:hypothetical protein
MDPEARRLTSVPAIAMLAVALMLGPGLPGALRQWDALAEPLGWLYLAFLAAVLVLTVGALCLLLSARLARAALLAASGAALALGAGLIVGTVLHEIPCLGPS